MVASLVLPVTQEATRESLNGDRGYQRLAAQIAAQISAGEFAMGDRLPSERALADGYGVSRTSVREAIIALEVQGLVEVRLGSGIYVSATAAAAAAAGPLQFSGTPGPFELLRARCLVESEVAALAAETRKDTDLDRIFAALAAMREHMDNKAANEAADRQFHLRIAEATGNSVLVETVAAMWQRTGNPMWSRMDEHFHTPALRVASQEDHERVLAALVARDPAAARVAMRAHLERVIAEFTRAWR